MPQTTDTVVATGLAAPERRVTAGYARYAVTLLMLVYVLNFIDRQVLSILAEPIKRDLGLADWQIGAMTGLAFAALYCFLGIPIARIAERGNRPWIIAASLVVWSGFTVVCGFANSFVHLVLARLGVGVGEAGCTPPALSLITDYAAPNRRASAIAFYTAGAPLGGLLGMMIGGLVADKYGWRAAFFAVGAPGLILAPILLLTLTEPRRWLKQTMAAKAAAAANYDFGATLKMLWRKPTYRLVVIAATLKAFIQYGTSAFLASFFFRNHAAELAGLGEGFGLKAAGFLGIALGLSVGVTGVAGTMLGGVLADRLGAKDSSRQTLVPAIGILISTPFFLWALFTPSAVVAMVILLLPGVLNALYAGPSFAIVQGLVPPEMRATATAIMLFIINLCALGLGPLCIGILSDILSNGFGLGDAAGVKWSLATFVLLGIPAGLLFLAAGKTVAQDTVS
ncbi:MAG: transporter [Caulobacteraceae bacterium]|nr:transporter [Caulobacteraceae bacterium]